MAFTSKRSRSRNQQSPSEVGARIRVALEDNETFVALDDVLMLLEGTADMYTGRSEGFTATVLRSTAEQLAGARRPGSVVRRGWAAPTGPRFD